MAIANNIVDIFEGQESYAFEAYCLQLPARNAMALTQIQPNAMKLTITSSILK